MTTMTDEQKKALKQHLAFEFGRDEELELAPAERRQYEEFYRKALIILRSQGRSLATQMLGVSRVIWTRSDAMPTACITVSDRRPKIYINCDFLDDLSTKVTDKCPVNTLLAGVLAHELMHFMFRHGSKLQRERIKKPELRNFVFDVFINHLLKKMSLHHFAEVFYPSEEEDSMMFFLNPSVQKLNKHAHFYKRVNDVQASLTDIEEYILKFVPDFKGGEALLMGSHDDSSDDSTEVGQGQGPGTGDGSSGSGDKKPDEKLGHSEQAELDEVIREFFTKEGKRNNKGFNKSGSKFGDYFDEHLQVEAKKDKDVEDFSKQALIRSVRGQVLASVGTYKGPTYTQTLRPQNNRHKLIQAAAGSVPLWWKKNLKIDFGKLRMYIDMSGSMTGLKDLIVSIILGLEKSWQLELFLFTTEVTSITKSELQQGNFRSGGTNFNAVFDHIRLSEGPKPGKVIMITDGYDAGLSKDNVELLDSMDFQLFVVYTKDHSLDCLDKYTKEKWTLDF